MQTISDPIQLYLAYISTSKKPSFRQRLFNKEQPQNYAVVLTPGEGSGIILPIVVGGHEAQGIAVVVEGMVASRPLGHDLFKNATEQFGYTLEFILIHKVDEKNIFHVSMHYTNGDKKVVLDARPSDAITAALAVKAPMLIEPAVLARYGVKTAPAPAP